jgi:hypothetical protein
VHPQPKIGSAAMRWSATIFLPRLCRRDLKKSVQPGTAKNIPAEAGGRPEKIVIEPFRLVLVPGAHASIYVAQHIEGDGMICSSQDPLSAIS